MPYAQATNFPTLYPTAYGALKWKADMQPGEVLLVHGAGGGSGLTAIEVGKAMGAVVIASAGGAREGAAGPPARRRPPHRPPPARTPPPAPGPPPAGPPQPPLTP